MNEFAGMPDILMDGDPRMTDNDRKQLEYVEAVLDVLKGTNMSFGMAIDVLIAVQINLFRYYVAGHKGKPEKIESVRNFILRGDSGMIKFIKEFDGD